MSSGGILRHGQYRRFAFAGIIAVALAAIAASAGAADAPNPAKWCADVIRINTQAGYMKHKHYNTMATPAQVKQIVTRTLAMRERLLAETPAEIKSATTHELTFFANWRESNDVNPTVLAPYTQADAAKLLHYQHAHCGITGP
jgi:hypothetical protein